MEKLDMIEITEFITRRMTENQFNSGLTDAEITKILKLLTQAMEDLSSECVYQTLMVSTSENVFVRELFIKYIASLFHNQEAKENQQLTSKFTNPEERLSYVLNLFFVQNGGEVAFGEPIHPTDKSGKVKEVEVSNISEWAALIWSEFLKLNPKISNEQVDIFGKVLKDLIATRIQKSDAYHLGMNSIQNITIDVKNEPDITLFGALYLAKIDSVKALPNNTSMQIYYNQLILINGETKSMKLVYHINDDWHNFKYQILQQAGLTSDYYQAADKLVEANFNL